MKNEEFVLTELKDWLENGIISVKNLLDKSLERHDGMETARLKSKYDSLLMIKVKIYELEKEEINEEKSQE